MRHISCAQTTQQVADHSKLIDYGTTYGHKEVVREGFPNLSPWAFVRKFCETHKGCTPSTVVTRIEFEYVEPA